MIQFFQEITEDFCINTPLMAILELRDNEISTIHENIAMMQHLTRLDLTNNNLLTLVDYNIILYCQYRIKLITYIKYARAMQNLIIFYI